MKKNIYRLMAGTMVVVTLMSTSACSQINKNTTTQNNGSNQSGNEAKGRFMEREIPLPDTLYNIMDYGNYNDQMTIYGVNNERRAVRYTYVNDKWVEETCEWLQVLIDQEKPITALEIASDGTPYILYYREDRSCNIAKVNEDGTYEDVPDKHGLDMENVSSFKLVGADEIVLSIHGYGVVRINRETGESIKEYVLSSGATNSFVIHNGEISLIDTVKVGVQVFDLESGQEKRFISYAGNMENSQLAVDKEGNLYLSNAEGISRLVPGGKMWEQLVEAALSTMDTTSNVVVGLDILSGEKMVALFNSMEGGHSLIEYYYDAEAPNRPITEVTLYMLEENMTIKQAIANYRRKNPEVMINVQIGREMGDEMTVSDAIRTLNTQILAGKGPDILLLDGLPVDSYIEKGVLLDLSDFAKEKIDNGEWVENVMQHYTTAEGKVYALPTRFSMMVALGEKDVLAQLTDLQDLVEWSNKNTGKALLYPQKPENLMAQLLPVTAQYWLDEKGQVDEKAYASFLEFIKANSNSNAANYSIDIERDGRSVEYFANGDTALHIQEFLSFIELDYLNSAVKMRTNSAIELLFKEDGGSFIPKGVLGINAQSAHKEIAREIVEIALSEETQGVDLRDGFTVNKKVLEKNAILDPENMVSMMVTNFEKPVQHHAAKQEDYNQVRDLALTVKTPTLQDKVLTTILIDEAKGYFNGDKTVEATVQATAKRAKAYLAE